MIGKTLRLLAPALIPSWQFFKTVGPSPRIEVRGRRGSEVGPWTAARPRPGRVSPGQMLRRLVWNPDWNETLYLVTCAERLAETGDPQREREILSRISPPDPACEAMDLRLVFVELEGYQLQRFVAHQSGPHPVPLS